MSSSETSLLLFNEFFGADPLIGFNVEAPNIKEEVLTPCRPKSIRHLVHRIVVFIENVKNVLIEALFYFSPSTKTPYWLEISRPKRRTDYIGIDTNTSLFEQYLREFLKDCVLS